MARKQLRTTCSAPGCRNTLPPGRRKFCCDECSKRKSPPAVKPAVDEALSAMADDQPKAAEPEVTWAFARKVKCPRCGSGNTQATSTQGRVQYRQCMMAVCRYRFKAYATEVKPAAVASGKEEATQPQP